MAQDYFGVLGLTPGKHNPRKITQRFLARREELLEILGDPARHGEAREALEDLYLAHAALTDPALQKAQLNLSDLGVDPIEELRHLIAASLEGGLLRHSRREMIIERAAALGLSPFHAQLLIAQVQFGHDEDRLPLRPLPPARAAKPHQPRVWARAMAVGVMSLAIFMLLLLWLEG